MLNASASSQSLCHEMFLTLPDFAGTVTRPRAPSVDVAAARSSSPLSGVGLSRCALGKRKARNHLWRGRNNSLHLCGRSEEHTSELQSLMRISYAVFCLKKKKKTNKTTQVQENYKVNKEKKMIQKHQQIHESKQYI